jgi:hypothetical protein
MLIGIMRRSTGETGWAFPSEYEFQTLLECDTLSRTQEKSTRETLLRELIVFKEKYDDNEQELVFDFVTKTNLCWEVFLEIIKYLTLNDAVKAFSDKIFPILTKYQIRLQLADPSLPFINMILRKIQSKQIVSLRLNTYLSWTAPELAWLTGFTNITSLSLLNLRRINLIHTYEEYFPNLIRLSLCYDNEVDFFILAEILKRLRRSIKRFEIHCGGVLCAHASYYSLELGYTQNCTIEYLLMDIGHFPLPSLNECFQNHPSCFLMTTTDLIKKMSNIRYVRLVTSRYNLEHVLDANQWKSVVITCHHLNKITVEVLDGILESEQLLQKVMELEKILHNDRPTIQFRIIFL